MEIMTVRFFVQPFYDGEPDYNQSYSIESKQNYWDNDLLVDEVINEVERLVNDAKIDDGWDKIMISNEIDESDYEDGYEEMMFIDKRGTLRDYEDPSYVYDDLDV